MFERLMNLDCELMVLGTKLFTVKESALANIRYGAAVVDDKIHESKNKMKKDLDEMKVKRQKEKAKKEETKKAEAKKVEAKKNESKKETKSKEPVKTVATIRPVKEEVEKVEAEIVDDPNLTRGVKYAPDFSGLENVTIPLDAEVVETVEEPVTIPVDDKKKKPVTEEDVDKALKKMRSNGIK